MLSSNSYARSFPKSRNSPGCLARVFLFASFVFACWLMVSTGAAAQLFSNQSLVSIPLPLVSGPAGVQPSQCVHHGSYTLTGKPCLRADFINQILVRAHSPARGTGQVLYDLSGKYGIDDTYALAFFEHESSFGLTGMARVTRSLGNIRCSQGYSCIQGYRAYPSWLQGEEDWYRLIRSLYVGQWHLTTVEQIVPVYAPATDGNDVPGYIRAVEQDVDAWSSEAQGSF